MRTGGCLFLFVIEGAAGTLNSQSSNCNKFVIKIEQYIIHHCMSKCKYNRHDRDEIVRFYTDGSKVAMMVIHNEKYIPEKYNNMHH